jgi:hypothetical protein
LSSGDWSISFWVYKTATANGSIVNLYNSAGNTSGLSIWIGSGGVKVDNGVSGGVQAGTVVVNAWSYIEVIRSSGTTTIYVNGVSAGTTTQTPNASQYGSFGSAADGTLPHQGYVTDLRIVKGTALSSSVPTAPLAAITNTSLLLNYTNAGILDNAMMNDLETVGNAQISTSVKKYGTGSLAFDGTGDWLVTSYTPNNALGSGDFTVEAFIYKNTNAAYMAVAGTMTSAAPYNTKWQLFSDAGGTKISWCTEAFLITSSATLSTGTWYHIAFVRSSGTLKLYIDGVFDSSSSDTRNYNAVGELWVGQVPENVSGRAWNGYIDEFRISKFARYTANFSVPTAAFPNN